MATITQRRKGFDPSPKAKAIRKGKRFASREGVKHLLRMNERFGERLGNQFAAALTYLSFLALIPILMVLFAVAGFVLANNASLLDQLRQGIADQIPSASLAETINEVLTTAIDQRVSVGIVGLLIALYSGIGWMTNLRLALEAVWRPTFEKSEDDKPDNIVLMTVKDLGRLVGLGLALAVTVALTTIGTAVQTQVLKWLGLDDWTWLAPVLSIITILVAMAADVLIFLWVYKTLPGKRYQVTRTALVRGAIAAAVLFEILKAVLSLILQSSSGSASWAAFGPIIGLLLFFNLVARMVLMVGAWIATAPGGPEADVDDHEVPEARVLVRPSITGPRVAGFLGAGAVAGWGAARRRRS
ncbi:inner membrane protein YhjD [Nakamurella flavida]|uniref:Inner membrane protein YhjD n=1 Tax=Nakamurella flavida TaxID=363630 RepID=A0A938YPM5_9ACTN|nr:inner membrane protein YhjD [Nakamurella flavida]MBM9475949.1 inner membrane protein YhjD [Nakamurella flavida]MBM9478391.1 inner membrane protein YhjD [Nakamurella flavida]MDP9777762.1 membrane protein [Nakamurella flavida]